MRGVSPVGEAAGDYGFFRIGLKSSVGARKHGLLWLPEIGYWMLSPPLAGWSAGPASDLFRTG